MPEVADADLCESSARRPKGLPAPGEPPLTERKEHELTHSPIRSWCPTCVRAKSKQNHSRTLKTKQPVIQLDYAFLGDNIDDPQVTLVTAIDLLSGLGLSCVVPSKGRSHYAQAELRRFVLETGRTFGILQIDPKALVAEITSEVGGLSGRHSPTGWKQAQGAAVGTWRSDSYAQIAAFKLDLEARYPGFDSSITHPLFSWLAKHAQWLLNRGMPERVMDLLPLRKRWGKPYSGSLCRFAEVVHFRKVGKFPKAIRHGKKDFGLSVTRSPTALCGSPHGVFKTRSLRSPPSGQIHNALLESLKSTPWDPKGSCEESHNFVFPPLGPRPAYQVVQRLEPQGSAERLAEPPHMLTHTQAWLLKSWRICSSMLAS